MFSFGYYCFKRYTKISVFNTEFFIFYFFLLGKDQFKILVYFYFIIKKKCKCLMIIYNSKTLILKLQQMYLRNWYFFYVVIYITYEFNSSKTMIFSIFPPNSGFIINYKLLQLK